MMVSVALLRSRDGVVDDGTDPSGGLKPNAYTSGSGTRKVAE